MKRVVDWSQWLDEHTNTTGWSKALLSNYVTILGIAGNPKWKGDTTSGKISVDVYKGVCLSVLNFIFPSAEERDRESTAEMAIKYWDEIQNSSPDDFKFDDTVIGQNNRAFRASPVLRSLVVHLKVADFDVAEFENTSDAEYIYPSKLNVNWNKSWSNQRGLEFKELSSFLKSNMDYSILEVKMGNETFHLCNAPGQVRAIDSEKENSSNAISSFNDIHPNWGLGKYLLYYGPPGTGKTREANRYIQMSLVDQLETSSGGEIQKADLLAPWDNSFREKVITEMRKFVGVCQFHASYSYEDFIEGLRPLPTRTGEIRYEVVDGSFMAIWRKAVGRSANLTVNLISTAGEQYLEIDPYFIRLYDLDIEKNIEIFIPMLKEYFRGEVVAGTSNLVKINMSAEEYAKVDLKSHVPVSLKGESWSPDNKYFLLIDEINRGKVSKIFGELLFGMSTPVTENYPEVRTQYSKSPLMLVKNLSLVCTMNSCDKSVDVLDQALKRRFELVELMPFSNLDKEHEPEWKKMVDSFSDKSSIDLSKVLDGLNSSILESEIDYDRQIGHSFMFKMNTLAKHASADVSDNDTIKDLYIRSVFQVYFADIFPVLQDFFLDQRELLEKFVPKGFLMSNSFALQPQIRRLITSRDIGSYGDKVWPTLKEEFFKTINSLAQNSGKLKRSA